jgi:hypothetical protein
MNKATFVSFHTDADLNQVPAGSDYAVSWRVKNSGTTTWGEGYHFSHIHEAEGSTQMASQPRFPLSVVASQFPVAPGEETNITFYGNFRPLEASDTTFTVYDPHLISRIDGELANGQGVTLQVDVDPADPYNVGVEQHWLLAVARQGDDYLAIDPLDGRAVSLRSRYGRQSRPQIPERALKETIISALIYRSTHVSEADDTDVGDQTGHSDLGRRSDL